MIGECYYEANRNETERPPMPKEKKAKEFPPMIQEPLDGALKPKRNHLGMTLKEMHEYIIDRYKGGAQ